MKISSLIVLCCVLYSSKEVYAEGDNDVKRGTFPYMAFLYYLDEKVVDVTQTRFLRAAVLIRPDWLISGAIDHEQVDGSSVGFPRKTLLARAGAILIDTNFTLNEDEDEQEREIIQIVRPYNHKPEKWWLTDITVLKTLLPFNITTAVAFASFNPRREYKEKNCNILIYAKLYNNLTSERHLILKLVELLPASNENCGDYFNNNSMACTLDSEDSKDVYDPDTYCQGNSGGPLICELEVMGIQTYIHNDCKPPHLYQLLYYWDTLISCSVDDNCEKEYFCSNVCNVTNKDPPLVTYSPTRASSPTSPESTETRAKEVAASEPPTDISSEDEVTSKITEAETTTTTATTSTYSETTTISTTASTETSSIWPKEALKDGSKKGEAEETDQNKDRRPKVEAQMQQEYIQEPKARGAAERNMCLIHNLLLGYFVVTCVI